jgi:hypothetical protein
MKKLLGPKKSEGLYSTRDVSLEILNVITV